MVHNRLNEREVHPNKHINFITALAMPGTPAPYSQEDARQLLRALAAQVRPIMKDRGLEVNSFEEYEFNRVFAGRNWDSGQTVEIVLRNVDGTFASSQWLIGVLCHELAHIKHMNHGPAFQRLDAQLRSEVLSLQRKGYFGDGYWSSGNRLADSARIGGEGLGDRDLPEYICGGAFTETRPQNLTRRRQRRDKPKKGIARVTGKGKFKGEGRALSEGTSNDTQSSGFRKQAGSKRAREERALAAEKRLRMLQGTSKEEPLKSGPSRTDSDTEDDDEDDVLFIDLTQSSETDDNRRRLLRENTKDDELEQMRSSMADFLRRGVNEKVGPSMSEKQKGKSKELDTSVIDLDDYDSPSSPVGIPASRQLTSNTSNGRSNNRVKLGPAPPKVKKGPEKPGIRQMAMDEMKVRKRESLGLTGSRKLGAAPAALSEKSDDKLAGRELKNNDVTLAYEEGGWTCLVCTLNNKSQHLACSACGSERGQALYKG